MIEHCGGALDLSNARPSSLFIIHFLSQQGWIQQEGGSLAFNFGRSV